jgi:methyl-accepting chemotaxis protein
MALLGNVRIGFRLAAGFFLVVAVFAGVALFQVRAMDRLGELAAEVDSRAKDAQMLAEVDSRYESLSTLVAEILAGGEPGPIRTELAQRRAQAEKDAEDAARVADTDMEKAQAVILRQNYLGYVDAVQNRLLPLVQAAGPAGPDRAALAALFADLGRLRGTGMDTLDKILKSMINKREEAAAAYVLIQERSAAQARWLSLAGVLLAVGLAVVMTLGITRPLKKALVFARAVARGDLTARLDVHQKDETGQTCAAVAAMCESLKAVLAEFEAQVRAVESGRLDRRADAGRFSGAFAEIIQGGDKLSQVLLGYLEAMPLPVLTMDLEFSILYMNAAGRNLVGKDQGALRGTKCHSLFQTGDCQTGSCACGRAMREGRPVTSETVARGTGRDLDIVYSGAPITSREGRIVGAFEVITDMTEVKGAQRKIEALAQEAGRISANLAEAAEELSSQVAQAGQGAEIQRGRAGETATAMTEMNSTVMEVARNASDAAGSAETAKDRAESGAGVVAQAIAAIEEVQRITALLTGNMDNLGKQVEGIGRIMTTINDIADQTNLLALNAAIEAARAGDAGRGFAVVADEVRKLAEKTMVATQEVGQAIAGIQEMTRQSVEATGRSAEAVARSTGLAHGSGQALREIVSMSEATSDQVRAIAAASEEQSAAAEEISRATEEINTVAQETSQAMQQAAQAIAGLTDMARELRELISRMQGSQG